jgi:DNA-binding LytR/AlgR family response regulator
LGLNGAELRALGVGWLVALAIVTLVTIFNVLTSSHEHPERGLLGPLIAEVSSALVTMVIMILPAAIALWLRRRSPEWWVAAPVIVLGAAAYTVLHVSGFVALRKLAFATLLDRHYEFGRVFGEFFYEAAKDVPAFALSLAAFWLVLRWLAPLWAPVGAAAPPAWFDIRDGARLVRAQTADILAVRSAGNYAEFLLNDGRRPLMRTSLSGLEARLAPLGFVRTHRSWLVNSARVTGLRPEGSGDYAVELGAVEAPLSRRFREALAVLRP